jgi:hypothetical protein
MNGRVVAVHAGLDASRLAECLVVYLMVVSTQNQRESATKGVHEFPVVVHALVCEWNDHVKTEWIDDLPHVRLGRFDDGLNGGTCKDPGSIDRRIFRQQSQQADLFVTNVHHIMGQGGDSNVAVQFSHVGVDPFELGVFVDSFFEIVHADVCLMVSKTDVRNVRKVHAVHHPSSLVEAAEKGGCQKVPGQDDQRRVGFATQIIHQRLEVWKVFQLVDVVLKKNGRETVVEVLLQPN